MTPFSAAPRRANGKSPARPRVSPSLDTRVLMEDLLPIFDPCIELRESLECYTFLDEAAYAAGVTSARPARSPNKAC